MPEAARLGDQIGHTSALTGLLIGALAGVAIAVAVVAIVGTGGVAAVAIGAGIAAAGAAGGLSGAYIGELIPTSPTGAILTGSFNVVIGGLPFMAARASMDTAGCSGVMPLFPHATPLIAQGSATVTINGMMAARKNDKLICGASISSGCKTVIIGGPTATVPGLSIDDDVPAWLKTALFGVMVVGTIIATGGVGLALGWGVAIGGLVGGLGGSALFGFVGGKIGRAVGDHYGNAELGERIGETVGGVVGGFLGGWAGSRVGGRMFPPRPKAPLPPLSQQKQASHVKGTPQYNNRVKQGKPTSAFDNQRSAEQLTQEAWAKGTPLPGRPNVREYDFGKPIGTGPRGGTQQKVRVHIDNQGRIHGHPSGPES